MTTTNPQAKRCGRTRRHAPHTWVDHPKATNDWDCDGRVGSRSSLQLVVQTPRLREIRGAGVLIAEGAISA